MEGVQRDSFWGVFVVDVVAVFVRFILILPNVTCFIGLVLCICFKIMMHINRYLKKKSSLKNNKFRRPLFPFSRDDQKYVVTNYVLALDQYGQKLYILHN